MDTLKKLFAKFSTDAPLETGCQAEDLMEREFTALIQKALGQELPPSPSGDLWAKIKAQAEIMPQIPPVRTGIIDLDEPISSLPTLSWLSEAMASTSQRPVRYTHYHESRTTRHVHNQHMAMYGQYMRSSMQYLRLNFGMVQGC